MDLGLSSHVSKQNDGQVWEAYGVLFATLDNVDELDTLIMTTSHAGNTSVVVSLPMLLPSHIIGGGMLL